MLTPEQHTERLKGLGGSDQADVFNEDWGCARRLWLEKRGVPSDYPVDSPLFALGHALEPVACEVYAAKTGRALMVANVASVHPEHEWMRCNVDRFIVPSEGQDGPGVLEVKTAGSFVFRQLRQGGLRNAYVLQLQWNMAVTGLKWGAFAVLNRDTGNLVYFDVERDDELIAVLIERGESFWRAVENGPMPDALPEIDKRCKGCAWRRQCRGEALLAAARMSKEDSAIHLEQDDSFNELLADYRQADQIADEANAVVDAIKDRIREQLGERTGVQCEAGRIHFRKQVSQRVDTAALKSQFPEIYLKVVRPSESRPLRIYTA